MQSFLYCILTLHLENVGILSNSFKVFYIRKEVNKTPCSNFLLGTMLKITCTNQILFSFLQIRIINKMCKIKEKEIFAQVMQIIIFCTHISKFSNILPQGILLIIFHMHTYTQKKEEIDDSQWDIYSQKKPTSGCINRLKQSTKKQSIQSGLCVLSSTAG